MFLVLILILSILVYILVNYICIRRFLLTIKKENFIKKFFLDSLKTKHLITMFILKVYFIICFFFGMLIFWEAARNISKLLEVHDIYLYLSCVLFIISLYTLFYNFIITHHFVLTLEEIEK